MSAYPRGSGKLSITWCYLEVREIMADVTDSADSRQLLNELRGKMLALKEHL